MLTRCGLTCKIGLPRSRSQSRGVGVAPKREDEANREEAPAGTRGFVRKGFKRARGEGVSPIRERQAPPPEVEPDLLGDPFLTVERLGGYRDKFSKTLREHEIVALLPRMRDDAGRKIRIESLVAVYACKLGVVVDMKAPGVTYGFRTVAG